MAIIDKSFPDISIHALVKRATIYFWFLFAQNTISIHALVKRATRYGDRHGNRRGISIHALVKRATQSLILALCQTWISIHALVKRATCNILTPAFRQCYFNPRPREEGDLCKFVLRKEKPLFQSTPS